MARSTRGKINGMYKHGMSCSPAHIRWMSMNARCNNPFNKKFPRYGGRGIKVCARWKEFKNFYADMGEPPHGLSLDRIDVNGDYSPENCRWSDQKTQQNNRENTRWFVVNGEKKKITELAKEYSISANIIRQRVDRDGRTIEQALLIEPEKK